MTKRINYIVASLVLIHFIGLILFGYLASAPDFSWITISLSALLIFMVEENRKKEISVFIVIFILGYLIEMIGVNTGILFGNYSYTNVMGPQLLSTPVFIGATWYAVVKGSVAISGRLSNNILTRLIISALACTLMDVLIEAVAMRYEFWTWKDNTVPLFNYFCWFLFSFIFSGFSLLINRSNNKLSSAVYIIWVLFFSILILM